MKPTPKISIAAVTYRSAEDTKAFLKSVAETTTEPYEVVIVNNGADPETLDYLSSLSGAVTVLHNPVNLGIGHAMNQAMRACRADYIVRSDSDVIIREPGWSQKMRALLDKHPAEVGAVGTAITGGVQFTGSKYTETDLICSCFMMIHRRACESIAQRAKDAASKILPRISEFIHQKTGHEGYEGQISDAYMTAKWLLKPDGFWDSGWASLWGFDDFDYSYALHWARLRLAKSDVLISHKDSSSRKGNEELRHINAARGAQYFRTKWSLIEDHWDDPEAKTHPGWHDLYFGLPALRAYRSRIEQNQQ